MAMLDVCIMARRVFISAGKVPIMQCYSETACVRKHLASYGNELARNTLRHRPWRTQSGRHRSTRYLPATTYT